MSFSKKNLSYIFRILHLLEYGTLKFGSLTGVNSLPATRQNKMQAKFQKCARKNIIESRGRIRGISRFPKQPWMAC